jgi:hypothetical protein
MDTDTLAAANEPADAAENRPQAAASSRTAASSWTDFARLLAEAYRNAPLFA